MRLIEAVTVDAVDPPLYRDARDALVSATSVYVVAGLAYALVLTSTWLWFTTQNVFALTRLLWLLSCYAWPAALEWACSRRSVAGDACWRGSLMTFGPRRRGAAANVPAVFLSYRRSETGGYAGRLADAPKSASAKAAFFRLAKQLPRTASISTRSIPLSRNREVLLVLIGDTWSAEQAADGILRLADSPDFVRLEVCLRAARRETTPRTARGSRGRRGTLPPL